MIYQTNTSNIIYECLQYVESFNLYKSGKKEIILNSNKNFDSIFENIKNIFAQARLMPAFGVSLHNDTLEELQSNTWLEINFSSEQVVNDLNFTALLFKLEETAGINLIRKHNSQYEGRCIYLDFENPIDLSLILNQTLNLNKLI